MSYNKCLDAVKHLKQLLLFFSQINKKLIASDCRTAAQVVGNPRCIKKSN